MRVLKESGGAWAKRLKQYPCGDPGAPFVPVPLAANCLVSVMFLAHAYFGLGDEHILAECFFPRALPALAAQLDKLAEAEPVPAEANARSRRLLPARPQSSRAARRNAAEARVGLWAAASGHRPCWDPSDGRGRLPHSTGSLSFTAKMDDTGGGHGRKSFSW